MTMKKVRIIDKWCQGPRVGRSRPAPASH